MAAERTYLSVPPDSTGKKVRMIHTLQIAYSGKSATQAQENYIFSVGERYPIPGYGSVHVHGAIEFNSDSGVLEVHIPSVKKYNNELPSAGDTINSDSDPNFVICTIDSVTETYYPAQNIMGWDNPEYGWNIDRFGAGNVRFSEGPAEITSFGSLRTSQSQLIAEYSFSKTLLPDEFSNTLNGSGSIRHVANMGYVETSIGTELNALTTHTSNLYHPHVPGAGTLYVMGNKVGDEGQVGVVRNWGCFDSTEGFMFRLNGTTLQVVHRRTFASGTYNDADDGSTDGKSEGIINQVDWNQDTLDGTGPSGMTINVSKPNTYFIDFQDVGGGVIRWGVMYRGERIVCHQMDMGNGGPLNTWTTNAIRNPNRPICWSMKRTDSGQGDVAIRYQYPLGAAVFHEGVTVNLMEEGNLRHYEDQYTFDENYPYTQGAFYINSIRPKLTIPSIDFTTGDVSLQENHSLYIPKTLQIWVTDQDNVDVPGELRVFSRCILKDENFKDITYTNLQEDTEGYHISHGPEIFRVPCIGPTEIDFNKYFSTMQNGAIKPNSEALTARRAQGVLAVRNDQPTASGNRAMIWVGRSPVVGEIKHLFEDKKPVTFDDSFGETSLHDQTYYLSLDGGDTAFLYNSEADINDDRAPRKLTLSTAVGAESGDQVNFVSGAAAGETAEVLSDVTNGTSVRLQGRSASIIDVGTVGDVSIHRERSISGIDYSGSPVLSVTAELHRFSVGEYVRIAGSTNFNTYTENGVSVTNGSAVITGSATNWQGIFTGGDIIEIEEEFYEISTVDSDTQITLTAPITLVTGSYTLYQVYDITTVPTADTFTVTKVAPPAITNIVGDGLVTVTITAADHGLYDDNVITISGTSAFNTTDAVVTVVDFDTFTITSATLGLVTAPESAGTITLQSTTNGTAISHVIRTVTAIAKEADTYYPKDFETAILALDGSAWTTPTEAIAGAVYPRSNTGDGLYDYDFGNASITAQVVGIGRIKGTPPALPTWTFMWRPFDRPARNSGDKQTLRMTLHWKERVQ